MAEEKPEKESVIYALRKELTALVERVNDIEKRLKDLEEEMW